MATITPFQKLNIQTELTSTDISRIQDNIALTTDAIRNAMVPRWIDVPTPFANGWSVLVYVGVAGSTHGGPRAVSYIKDASGFVHLRGLIIGGTISGTATGTVFTLPVGYRPYFQGSWEVSDSGTTITVVDNGDVRVSSSTNAWAYLNGVSFLAEQ